jgi:hypothetical protein
VKEIEAAWGDSQGHFSLQGRTKIGRQIFVPQSKRDTSVFRTFAKICHDFAMEFWVSWMIFWPQNASNVLY